MPSKEAKYSVVIPVYNSAHTVALVVDQVADFFGRERTEYEIVLVNDGSRDASWDVLKTTATGDARIIAVNLLQNYGQHTALYCGFQYCTGERVITLDDDLQNPPAEIGRLIEKADEGHDVVFGRYRQKRHPWGRVMGSLLIRQINRRIFHCPRELVPTNFRLIQRDVIDRMLQYQTAYPYITGLTLMFAANPANVWVEHLERPGGKSNYTLRRILSLVARILFNYSLWPLRFVSTAGLIISFASFLIGLGIIYVRVFRGFSVEGWAGIMVMLSFFNGVTVLMLGMLGEYTARILRQVSSKQAFHVKEVIAREG